MSSATVRLKKSFDPHQLTTAYHSLNHIQTKPANFPGDGSIAWNSLSVYSQGDDLYNFQTYLPFIADLGLQFRLVRFLTLEPGGYIKEHVDTFLSGRVVRLHIPVITNDQVEFYLGGERCHWQEGEFWFGDFTVPHWVSNKSDVTRVHLVLDVAVDEKLLELFSLGTIPEKLYDSLKKVEEFDQEILERFSCDFWVPAGFTLPGSDFPPLKNPLVANFKLVDGEFCLFINDAPMVKAIPITENKLSVLGLKHAMSADYTFENDKAKSLTFHIAGKSLEVELA